MKMKFDLESCRNVVNELQSVIDGSLGSLTLARLDGPRMIIKLSKNKKKLIVKIKEAEKECECECKESDDSDFMKDFKEIVRNGLKGISQEEADEIADDLQGFLEETYKGRLEDKEIRKTIENEKVFDGQLTDEEVKILSDGFKSIGLEDNDTITAIINSMCKSTPKFIMDNMIELIRNGNRKILKVYMALANAADAGYKRYIDKSVNGAIDKFLEPLSRNPIVYMIQPRGSVSADDNYPIFHALIDMANKLNLSSSTSKRIYEFIEEYRLRLLGDIYDPYIENMASILNVDFPYVDENELKKPETISEIYKLYNFIKSAMNYSSELRSKDSEMIEYVKDKHIPILKQTLKAIIE